MLLRMLSTEPESEADVYAQALLGSDGDREELLRGLGTLIDSFVSMFKANEAAETDDGPPQDSLHLVVPAVVAKLAGAPWLPARAVPTMAAALTASALGRSCHEWRSAYGPWKPWEFLPWTYTALFLADLIDFSRETPGLALDLVERVLLTNDPT